MRHLGSIVLSFVLASLVYVAAGVGMSKMFQAELERGGPVNRLDAGAMAVGVLLLLVAGALYTLLAMPRISPLGPVLVGLTFIGIQVWSLVAPSGFVKLMPRSVFGVRAALDAPVEFGLTLFLAVPLLATIVSPRRWSGGKKPAVPAPYAPAPPLGYPGDPAHQYPPAAPRHLPTSGAPLY